jgi:DNA-binding CsgD family transcriptional regulator
MNALAPKIAPQVLRVFVVAAEPQRLLRLTQIVRALGHSVVATREEASVVLADGVILPDRVPTVSLGIKNHEAEGKLAANASSEQIDAALRAVAAGLRITDETDRTFDALDENDAQPLLTPREIEVLTAVSNGLANKEIARDLGISLHTVKFHLESLMRKMGVSSRTEAVSMAMRLRLLEWYRV